MTTALHSSHPRGLPMPSEYPAHVDRILTKPHPMIPKYTLSNRVADLGRFLAVLGGLLILLAYEGFAAVRNSLTLEDREERAGSRWGTVIMWLLIGLVVTAVLYVMGRATL